MEIEEIKAVVHGRVQMVMFRDFIQRKSRTMGLVGVVRNLESSSVEVVAQGSREKLENLIEYLRKGPFLARVLKVDVDWREPRETFDGFKIVY